MFSGVTPYTVDMLTSPLPTPTTIEMMSVVGEQAVTFNIQKFPTEKEAYDEFLSRYEGTEIRSFLEMDKLNDMGYFGYHTWYPDTLSVHSLVYTGTYVIHFQNTNTKIYNSDFLRILAIEPVVLEVVQQLKEQRNYDEFVK
jgi:hypothetical protein